MAKISLHHGSGGGKTRELVENIFQKYFSNPILNKMDDAAVLNLNEGKVAFTTDSFVVKPMFFEGADIGKLAVCGTVNDLSVMGAKPVAISSGFIIEEGFEIEDLEKILKSMKDAADEAGVKIVTGDTKVVDKGNADGIYINTSGIGVIPANLDINGAMAKPGDVIIVNGYVGNHGAAIITAREELGFMTQIKSDAAPLNGLIEKMLKASSNIHVMRDATRGGLATVLNEIAIQSEIGIEILEEKIPIEDGVRGVCGLLGLDPLYLANEGRIVAFVKEQDANNVLTAMKEHKYGKYACIIGRVVDNNTEPVVVLKTAGRGSRILDILAGEPLPRIC